MIKLNPDHVQAIEKALGHGKSPEAIVKMENGQIVVLKVEKKKVV